MAVVGVSHHAEVYVFKYYNSNSNSNSNKVSTATNSNWKFLGILKASDSFNSNLFGKIHYFL